MSDAIRLSYCWDQETFLKASKAAYKYEMKHSPKRFLGWIFIAMTQFGVVAALKKGVVGLLLISTILVVYWYFFRWNIRKKLLLKSFEKSSTKNHCYSMVADKEGIHSEAITILWEHVNQVVALHEGFLIYSDASSLFIPTNAFADEEKKNDFAILAKQKAKAYTREY